MSPPDYQELASSEMPYAHPSEGVTIKVISGVAQGNEKVCREVSYDDQKFFY